ncbi:MAG: preprotein translocase subunit YajC [Pontixanthobacter sp.]
MFNLLSAASTAGSAPQWLMILPYLGIGVIFWMLIIRPQTKRHKEHQDRVASLKKGDKVVTAGGLVGKIVRVEDHYVDIELAQGVRVKAVKNTIGDIIPPAGLAAND